jgi:hypothetical protein
MKAPSVREGSKENGTAAKIPPVSIAVRRRGRPSTICPIGIKSYPAIALLSPESAYAFMLTSLSQFQAQGWEIQLSRLRFAGRNQHSIIHFRNSARFAPSVTFSL